MNRTARSISRVAATVGSIAVMAVLPAVGALPTAAGAAARTGRPAIGTSARTAVLSCRGVREVRPRNYIITCADADTRWKKARWTHWGADSATAMGFLYQDNCKPNCADGHFHSYAATIELSAVKSTKQYGDLFTKAKITYSKSGKTRIERFGLAD